MLSIQNGKSHSLALMKKDFCKLAGCHYYLVFGNEFLLYNRFF